MKTIYILVIFLVSFSYSNAQDNSGAKKIESNVIVSENIEDISLTANSSDSELTVKEVKTTESSLVRTNSDIRIYLNRVRNVENIDLLFPKLNIRLKA